MFIGLINDKLWILSTVLFIRVFYLHQSCGHQFSVHLLLPRLEIKWLPVQMCSALRYVLSPWQSILLHPIFILAYIGSLHAWQIFLSKKHWWILCLNYRSLLKYLVAPYLSVLLVIVISKLTIQWLCIALFWLVSWSLCILFVVILVMSWQNAVLKE